MKRYEAKVEISSQLVKVEFETDGSPVKYLWDRYGMSSYIEYIEELKPVED